jgi:hypothetical protein
MVVVVVLAAAIDMDLRFMQEKVGFVNFFFFNSF